MLGNSVDPETEHRILDESGFAWTIAGLVTVWFLLFWYGQVSGRDDLLHWAGVVAIGSLGTLFSIQPTLVIFLDIIYRHMLYYAVTARRVLILDVRGELPFSLTGYPITPSMTLKLHKGRYSTIWLEDQYKTDGVSVEVSYNSARPKALRLAQGGAKVRDLFRTLAEGKRA